MNAPQQKQPEYQLKREPDGRSWTARENLVDILERELLGRTTEQLTCGLSDSQLRAIRKPARLP